MYTGKNMKKKETIEGSWEFNAEVSKNFNIIAKKSIPHYEIVIEKCLQITKKAFPDIKKTKIIDIGSAIGHTLDVFIKAGYENVYGVESSKYMIQNSKYKEKIFFSDSFPKDKKYFDIIIANWTLHFINKRKQYIKDVYSSLSKGGYFIATDKMLTSAFVNEMYHDFKRHQGLSEEDIEKKALEIKGVLVTKPLSWYLETFIEVGFSEITIIDTDWCFVTILCKK